MNIAQKHSDFRIDAPLLVSDDSSQPAYHRRLRGISFGMISRERDVHAPIRIIVTLQAIAALSRQRDYDQVASALSDFRNSRDQISLAANAKFARLKGVVEKFEDVPTVLLMTGDIP